MSETSLEGVTPYEEMKAATKSSTKVEHFDGLGLPDTASAAVPVSLAHTADGASVGENEAVASAKSNDGGGGVAFNTGNATGLNNAFSLASVPQLFNASLASANMQMRLIASSVAATDGSPPNSPRSSLSSFQSSSYDPFTLPYATSYSQSSEAPIGSFQFKMTPPLFSVVRSPQPAFNCRNSKNYLNKRGDKSPLVTLPESTDDTSKLSCKELYNNDSSLSHEDEAWEVQVESVDFKFCCSHFVAYKGYREKLHGHNYTMSLRVGGLLNEDGYILDFGLMKKVVRTACNALNENFLLPMKSDVLDITEQGESCLISCEDGAEFRFPKSDCVQLPIVHSTAEELASYLWSVVVSILTPEYLHQRHIEWIQVNISERPSQSASFRKRIPSRSLQMPSQEK